MGCALATVDIPQKIGCVLILKNWIIVHDLCCLRNFFPFFFQKINSAGFRIPVRAKSSGPDQASHFVGPDLGPNFLHFYLQTTPAEKELHVLCFVVKIKSCILVYYGSFPCMHGGAVWSVHLV